MSFTAWVVSLTCAEDVNVIESYLKQMKRGDIEAAYINADVVFERDNVFPAGTVALLMTADRSDLYQSIVDDCGLTTFRGAVGYITEFETGPVEEREGRAFVEVLWTRPALPDCSDDDADPFDLLRALFAQQ